MAGTAVFSWRTYRLSAFPHRHLKSPHLTCKSLTQKVTIGKGLLFHSTHVRTQTFRTPHTHTHLHTHGSFTHVCTCAHTNAHTQSHISQPCSVLRVCWAPWCWALSGPDHSQGWCVHTLCFSLHLWPSRIAPLKTLSSKEAIQASVSEASSGEHTAWDSSKCSAHHLEPGPRLLHWGFCKSAGTQCSHNLTHWPGFCICCPLQTPLTQAAHLCCWAGCPAILSSPPPAGSEPG